jgi:uncharacterized caspase-like protein
MARFRWGAAGFLLWLALFACCAATFADERVALVVGNSNYKSTAALANPTNDANDVAQALTSLGFKVLLSLDADKRGLDRAIEQFARSAQGANAALFYYAGHGMQFQGRNYLVPVDAELRDQISVRYELTAIDDVKEALQNSGGVEILILDSCRDNPLAEHLVRSLRERSRDLPDLRGLAPIDHASGMIVVYATQANDVAEDGNGRNSPFSEALLRELKEPGLEVETMFRRVQEDVVKATGGRQTPEVTMSFVPQYTLNQNETDETIWAGVRDSGDVAALRAFVERYPDSVHVADAKALLAALQAQETSPTALTELTAKLEAAEAERRRLEQELAKHQTDNASVAQNESLKGDVETLKAEISRLQQQVAETAKQKPQVVAPTATPTPLPTPTVVAATEVIDLAQVRAELRRIGCYAGGDIDWSAPEMRAGVAKYAQYANLGAPPATPTVALLEDLRRRAAGFCPPQCSARETLVGGRCVAKTCAPNAFLTASGVCAPKPRPNVAAVRVAPPAVAHPKPAPVQNCFVYNGKQFCE